MYSQVATVLAGIDGSGAHKSTLVKASTNSCQEKTPMDGVCGSAPAAHLLLISVLLAPHVPLPQLFDATCCWNKGGPSSRISPMAPLLPREITRQGQGEPVLLCPLPACPPCRGTVGWLGRHKSHPAGLTP